MERLVCQPPKDPRLFDFANSVYEQLKFYTAHRSIHMNTIKYAVSKLKEIYSVGWDIRLEGNISDQIKKTCICFWVLDGAKRRDNTDWYVYLIPTTPLAKMQNTNYIEHFYRKEPRVLTTMIAQDQG